LLHKRFQGIEFHNSAHAFRDPQPLVDFFVPPIDAHLTVLTLDASVGVDVKRLFEFTPFFRFLSLAGCNIDVVQMIRLASLGGNLRIVDLSANIVDPKAKLDFRIPPRLKAVILDQLEIHKPDLIAFLMNNLPADSTLSVCDLKIPTRSPVPSDSELTGSSNAPLVMSWESQALRRVVDLAGLRDFAGVLSACKAA
jgi:hypothetical protein